MRLYLSSYRLGNKPEKLTGLFTGDKRVGIILNARDASTPQDRVTGLQVQIEELNKLGIESNEVDLRNFKDSQEVRVELSNYAGVWIPGGNAFLLRRAMYDSGFDSVIGSLVGNKNFVYAGYSAGSAVTGTTMRGQELVDDAGAVGEVYGGDVIWDGLGLVSYSIAPHYKSDQPESSAIDKVVDYFIKENIPYKPLQDGQAIVVSAELEEIAG
jgi:dipeptidase E